MINPVPPESDFARNPQGGAGYLSCVDGVLFAAGFLQPCLTSCGAGGGRYRGTLRSTAPGPTLAKLRKLAGV